MDWFFTLETEEQEFIKKFLFAQVPKAISKRLSS